MRRLIYKLLKAIEEKDTVKFQELLKNKIAIDRETVEEVIQKILECDHAEFDPILYPYLIKRFGQKSTPEFLMDTLANSYSKQRLDLVKQNMDVTKYSIFINKALSIFLLIASDEELDQLKRSLSGSIMDSIISNLDDLDEQNHPNTRQVMPAVDRLLELLLELEKNENGEFYSIKLVKLFREGGGGNFSWIKVTSLASDYRKMVLDISMLCFKRNEKSFKWLEQEINPFPISESKKSQILSRHVYAKSYEHRLLDKSLDEIIATQPLWAVEAFLMKENPEIVGKRNSQGSAVLICAVRDNNPNRAEVLVRCGVSVSFISSELWFSIYENSHRENVLRLKNTLLDACYEQRPKESGIEQNNWDRNIFEILSPAKFQGDCDSISSTCLTDALVNLNKDFLQLAKRFFFGSWDYEPSDQKVLDRVSELLEYEVTLAEGYPLREEMRAVTKSEFAAMSSEFSETPPRLQL